MLKRILEWLFFNLIVGLLMAFTYYIGVTIGIPSLWTLVFVLVEGHIVKLCCELSVAIGGRYEEPEDYV